MKKQRLLRYCGILLILLPFLGLYEYMKTFLYVFVGILLLLNSSSKRDSLSTSKKAPKEAIPRQTFPKIVTKNNDPLDK